LGKAEAAKMKAFISTATDHFRPSYGRVAQDFPRQCVFAATINPGVIGYLKDETGNRRFWPVKCGVDWAEGKKVDTDALAEVRGQLWAEARDRYAAGEQWWLEDHLEADAAAETAKRLELDTWYDDIAAYIVGKDFVTSGEIFDNVVHVEMKDRDLAKQRRIGKALRSLKWMPGTGRVNGKSKQGFKAPAGWLASKGEGTVVQLFPQQAEGTSADFDADTPGEAGREEMEALLA
jgi:putative DNA primase/helicase